MRVVNTLDELLALPSDRYVNGFRKRVPVRLEIPALTKPVLVRAQFALNELQERCGSAGAAGFMFVTLLYGVVQVFQRHTSLLSWNAAFELAVVLGLSFAAGAAGKFVALAITRWQFAHRCRAQYRRLSETLQAPAALVS
jgi:hypothetical protein